MNALRRRRASEQGRRAVTLIELMLVLAIVILVAAAAWPSIQRSMADQRLKTAADIVRAEWQSARAKAISSGVAYQFCYMPDERTYWIEPCEEASAADANAGGSATATEADLQELPERVSFVQGKVVEAASEASGCEAAGAMEQEQPTTVEDGELNAPVIFSPDGTCSSAELTLCNDRERSITVSIHGLTAIPVVGDVFSSEGTSL